MQVFNEGRGTGWQHIYFTTEYETTRDGPRLGIRWKIKWNIDKNYWYGYNLVAEVWTEGNNYGRQIKANSPNRGGGEAIFPENGDWLWFEKGYACNEITNCRVIVKTTNGGSAKIDSGADKTLTTPTGYVASNIKDSIDFIVGNNLKIKIDDKTNQNYNYLLYLDVMNDSNSWENVKSLTTTNKEFTLDLSSVINTIYSKIKTRNTSKIRIRLNTYINNTALGYTIKEGTCYIKNSNPNALTFTVTGNEGTEITELTSGYGPYNDKSNIYVNVSKILNSNGVNSAELKKVKITAGMTTKTLDVSDIVGTGIYQIDFIDPFAIVKDNELINGNGSIIVAITDSRGNTTQAKKELTISRYIPAYFTELELKRDNNIDTTTRLIAKGKTMSGITVKYNVPQGEELGELKTINASYITVNETTGEFTVNAPIEGDLGANGFTKDEEFEVYIRLNDSWNISSPSEYIRRVRRGNVLMHYGKKGIAFGALYDEDEGGLVQVGEKNILEQKVLWDDYSYMNASQTVNVPISQQVHGVMLMFCAYSDGQPHNWDWISYIILKKEAEILNGGGRVFPMGNSDGITATKYIYIYPNKIEGNDANQQGNSKNYVLRKIIGF